MRSVISPHGKRLSKTVKPHTCRGCGRILPKQSWMLIWSVWVDFMRERFHLCSDCQRIIYECKERPPLNHQENEWLVRDMCMRCDGFPFCPRVEYIRESKPGDLFLGDVSGVGDNRYRLQIERGAVWNGSARDSGMHESDTDSG